MADKGILELDEHDDLSRFILVADGYSGVLRDGKRLYPQKTEAGQLFFSRAKAEAPLLIDWKTDIAA